jgi:tRNA G18 (ribose-2'-O)-methylase SpoU
MKILILENIRSAENTGSILRTAEALGVEEVLLVGTTPTPIDRFGRVRNDIKKVALGAESMPWKFFETMREAVDYVRTHKLCLLVLEQDVRSISYQSCQVHNDFALVVGNEVEGVSAYAKDSADTIIEIPLLGKKESLNVSVALGIALASLVHGRS